MKLPDWLADEAKSGRLLNDAHIYGGLTLMALGGWKLSPAWTLIGVGCIFVILGIVAAIPRRRRPE